MFELLLGATKELGFDHFALVHHDSMAVGRVPAIRIVNYPAEWILKLKAEPWSRLDPVHSACRRTNVGFAWDELPGSMLSREQQRMFRDAARYGLATGFTVPIHFPGDPAASLSLATRRGLALSGERRMCAEVIAAHAFRAARRLAGNPPPRPRLSPRQIQCLALVASGKTDWEIGRILGIGEETVRSYMKWARSAYDAVTRAQLVALALRSGAID